MEFINTVTLQGTLKFDVKVFDNGPGRLTVETHGSGSPSIPVNVWGSLKDDLVGMVKNTQITITGRLVMQKVYPPIKVQSKYGEKDLWEISVNVDGKSGGAITVLNAPAVADSDDGDDDLPF
jgi:hypothetical protein